MKMKLGLLLCAPALLLAACDNGPSKYEVTEDEFKAVVLDYGFYAGANATYAVSNTGTLVANPSMTYGMSGTVEVDGVKVHANFTVQEGPYTETQESAMDYTNATAATPTYDMYYKSGDTWVKMPDLEFKGYSTEVRELGLYFNGLAYSDFTYDKESKTYKLNAAKEIAISEYNKVTYNTMAFSFENKKLVKVEATYSQGEGEYAMNGNINCTASKLGETTVTLPTVA